MLEEITAYLEKMGYTSEEQGSIEKYLVVFREGKPLGFILSDCSLRLVTDAKGAEGVRGAVAFFQKNRNLKPVGNGEFLVSLHRGNQVTTFYDMKNRHEMFAVYLEDKNNGETSNTIFETADDAEYYFIQESHQIDLNRYLPRKESLSERLRGKLLHYLLSKLNRQPERS